MKRSFLIYLAVYVLERLAKRTDTVIDDIVVDSIKKLLFAEVVEERNYDSKDH